MINDNEGYSVKDQSISGDLVADVAIMLVSSEVAKEKDERKVLGLVWNSSTDSFVFRLGGFGKIFETNKRNLLKIVAKLFTPSDYHLQS